MELETLSRRISQWVQTNREEAVGLVQRLVRIESVNHPPVGNERAFQQTVAEWLRTEGAEVDVYYIRSVPGLEAHPAYLQGRDYSDRPNVVGRFRGEGGGRSLMFSSHADTVHEGRKPWRFPPFGGVIEGGKLYGRGAYDMKGGLAASLMAIRCLRDLGVKLKGDVIAESVVDEEYGGSNGALAARLHGPDADIAIIPEPSNLKLYPAHLGGGAWKAFFTGTNGIVFNGEQLVNALDAAVDFVRLLREFGDYRRNRYPVPALWRSSKEAEVVSFQIVTGDPNRELPEMSDNGEVRFWIEGYPGMTGNGIIEELWAFYESRLDAFPILRSCRPVISPMIRYLEGSAMPDDERCRTFLEVAASTGEHSLGKPCGELMGAPFTCDAFMFNRHSSTPALVLGPTGGNAHAPDEYLEIDSYLSLIGWYAELTANWCGICSTDDGEVK